MDALQVLQGKHAVFFPEKSNGRESLGIYLVACPSPFWGARRWPFVCPRSWPARGHGLCSLLVGADLLFGRDEESGRATPWRGLLVGGLGAGLLAVSISQTVLGRTAFRSQLPAIAAFPVSGPALVGVEDNGSATAEAGGRIALAGACAGLLPYTYTPAHFTPLLFLLLRLELCAARWQG